MGASRERLLTSKATWTKEAKPIDYSGPADYLEGQWWLVQPWLPVPPGMDTWGRGFPLSALAGSLGGL